MKNLVLMASALLILSQTALAQDDPAAAGDRRAAFREKMQERMMEKDANGDGNIDKAEFMANAEEKFAKMDADGDGIVTPAELQALREKFKEHHKDGAPESP